MPNQRKPERHQTDIDLGYPDGRRPGPGDDRDNRAGGHSANGYLARDGLHFNYPSGTDETVVPAVVDVDFKGSVSIKSGIDGANMPPDIARRDALAILNNQKFISGERARLAKEGLNADTIATMVKRGLGVQPDAQPAAPKR